MQAVGVLLRGNLIGEEPVMRAVTLDRVFVQGTLKEASGAGP